MSDNRNHPLDGKTGRRSWKRCRQLAALLAVGFSSAGAALAVENLPAQEPGDTCGWDALQGASKTPPEFVLAFDGDLNVQGLYRPGARTVPENDVPSEKAPDAEVYLEKHGSATVYCWKVDGKRECIEVDD
jgi:hypothetical protein